MVTCSRVIGGRRSPADRRTLRSSPVGCRINILSRQSTTICSIAHDVRSPHSAVQVARLHHAVVEAYSWRPCEHPWPILIRTVPVEWRTLAWIDISRWPQADRLDNYHHFDIVRQKVHNNVTWRRNDETIQFTTTISRNTKLRQPVHL